MNPYIATHIFNAKAMARNFEQACQQAAKQDDGKISKEEEKILRKIQTITARFVNDLDKLS